MKKTLLLILTATIFFNCATTKQKTYPEYVLGTKANKERKRFDKDSLNIVTPSIEI